MLQYDKVMYLLEKTPENEHLVSGNIMVHDYPDGQIDIKYLCQSLGYSIFGLVANNSVRIQNSFFLN